MQYFLCPRCQFKVQANKHICQTCGNKFAPAAPASGGTGGAAPRAIVNPFAKLLKLDNQSKQKEAAQEKPALG